MVDWCLIIGLACLMVGFGIGFGVAAMAAVAAKANWDAEQEALAWDRHILELMAPPNGR